ALGALERHRELLKRVVLAGALVGVAGNAVFATEWLAEFRAPWVVGARRLLVESGFLGLTLAYAAALALAFQRARWRDAIARLAPLGQMALSGYLLQTVGAIGVF